MKKWKTWTACMVFLSILCSACSESFLDEKADAGIGTPYQLSDYRAMMDNAVVMNFKASYALGIFGGDELNLQSNIWETAREIWLKNAYIWADDVFEGTGSEDWNTAYTRILYTNLVLEGLDRISLTEHETAEWNRIRGAALFFRGLNYFQLAQLFMPVYNVEVMEKKLGLPIRLSSDVNVPSERSTVRQTYDQILKDLENAVELLPEKEITTMRPSKAGCYGVLARIYLQLSEYEKAARYASKALDIQNGLIDYNDLAPKSDFSFESDWGAGNKEILFLNYMNAYTLLTKARMNVANELLDLYQEIDLRKKIFYKTGTNKNIYFCGSYMGSGQFFVGPTTAEMYLIRAETNARSGNIKLALEDINHLRKYRLDKSLFVQVEITDEENLLRFILNERMRELAFRGQRWEDLRRLNKDPRFVKKIFRTLNDKIFSLEPNASKYVWPIADDVVNRSGIKQNDR